MCFTSKSIGSCHVCIFVSKLGSASFENDIFFDFMVFWVGGEGGGVFFLFWKIVKDIMSKFFFTFLELSGMWLNLLQSVWQRVVTWQYVIQYIFLFFFIYYLFKTLYGLCRLSRLRGVRNTHDLRDWGATGSICVQHAFKQTQHVRWNDMGSKPIAFV